MFLFFDENIGPVGCEACSFPDEIVIQSWCNKLVVSCRIGRVVDVWVQGGTGLLGEGVYQ